MVFKKKSVQIFIFILMLSLLSFSQGEEGSGDNEGGQDAVTLNYNLLLPPSSPAFTLLDVSPESVERPSTPTDLIVTILKNTNNLDAIPENFALEFAPYWISKKSDNSESNGTGIWDTILQTLTISVATSTKSIESDSSSEQQKQETALGFGFRFSFLQGVIENETLKELKDYVNDYHDELQEKVKNDIELNTLITQLINLKRRLQYTSTEDEDEDKEKLIEEIEKTHIKANERLTQIRKEHDKQKEDLIKEITAVPIRRTGAKVDVAGGIGFNFPDKIFRNGELDRWGVWVNGGYQGKKSGIFGVIRYLGNKNKPNTLDLGGRLVFDISEKFAASAESTYRINLNSEIKNQWGFDGIFEYSIAKNQSIAMVIGKDNRDDVTPGKLVAKLVFKAGLGSKRPM